MVEHNSLVIGENDKLKLIGLACPASFTRVSFFIAVRIQLAH